MEIANKHVFSFYYESDLYKIGLVGAVETISAINLIHRIINVVKLVPGEFFILFDRQRHILAQLVSSHKKNIVITICSISENRVYSPEIIFFLPLLKKEALEESIYSLVEVGVNAIQLITTEKSRKNVLTDKDMDRLQNIIIAAAEQSKVFRYPVLQRPISLQKGLENNLNNAYKIFFNPDGKSFFDLQKKEILQKICLIVGPEGGFLEQELLALKKAGFYNCALTPTILRSVQAVAIGAALFRLS